MKAFENMQRKGKLDVCLKDNALITLYSLRSLGNSELTQIRLRRSHRHHMVAKETRRLATGVT